MHERKQRWSATKVIAIHRPISREIYDANMRELARVLYHFYREVRPTEKITFEKSILIETKPKEVA